MATTERAANTRLYLPSAEIPGNEQIIIISNTSESLLVVVQHNSIYGDGPRSKCTEPVVAYIRKDNPGKITAYCSIHPHKKLKLSSTQILITTKQYIFQTRETPPPKPITPEDILYLSKRFGRHTKVLEALVIPFNNNLHALERFLEATTGSKPDEKQINL